MSDPVVIVGIARTPMGAFQGAFSAVPAHQLGAAAIKAAMEEAGVKADDVEQTIMGCVLPADKAKPRRAKPPSAQACRFQQKPQPSTKCADRVCRLRSWRMTRSKRAV